MHPYLETTQLPASPFDNRHGGINVRGLCTALDIDRTMLSKTLGISRQAVAQYFSASGKRFIRLRQEETRGFFTKLNQVYVLLEALVDKDVDSKRVVTWFHSANKALRGRRPVDLVAAGEVDELITKLMDVITAAHGG